MTSTTPSMPAGAPATGSVDDQVVAVVGLGYVGLPLALGFLDGGLTVHGIDASPRRVQGILEGVSPIDDVSDATLTDAVARGLGVHGLDGAIVRSSDAVVVCVPTPVNPSRDPDLVHVLEAGRFVGSNLRAGQLVVLQSTTFPGTTSGPFREALEAASTLQAGRDFDLAFAPERVNPGDPASVGRAVPRVVGGLTPDATARAATLFEHVNERVIQVSSPDAAEMAKLLENIFRNVNIALVNQLALLCERMGIDVWEVIDAAATKPFGFMRFTPGPGIGGHCIPVDPYYLSWRARQFGFVDRFVELAGDINTTMPRHVADLVAEALNARGLALKGARVGVLGVTFKPDVQDARNSPAADVIALVRGRGGEVRFHDPHVDTFTDADGIAIERTGLDDLLATSDVVVVLVAHRAIDWDLVLERSDLVVDTVGVARGRSVRPGAVLLLGAGWLAGSQPFA